MKNRVFVNLKVYKLEVVNEGHLIIIVQKSWVNDFYKEAWVSINPTIII